MYIIGSRSSVERNRKGAEGAKDGGVVVVVLVVAGEDVAGDAGLSGRVFVVAGGVDVVVFVVVVAVAVGGGGGGGGGGGCVACFGCVADVGGKAVRTG